MIHTVCTPRHKWVFTIAYKEHVFTKQYIIDTYGPSIDWYSLRMTLNKIIKNEY